MFIMQGSGERLLVLEPVEGCSINCSRVSVLLKPSDFCKFLSILVDGNILLGCAQLVILPHKQKLETCHVVHLLASAIWGHTLKFGD